jgi:hypothetical protein
VQYSTDEGKKDAIGLVLAPGLAEMWLLKAVTFACSCS